MWNFWAIELLHRNQCGQAVLQCRPTFMPPMETSSLLFHPARHLLCHHTRRIGAHQAQQDKPIHKDMSDLRFLPDHQRLREIIAVYRLRLPRLEEEAEAVDGMIEVVEAVEEEAEAIEEGNSGVVNIETAYYPYNNGIT
jgi:hypothetical protein